MIFDLDIALKPTALKVTHDNKPVAYSWGNEDALHKWIEAMNKNAIASALGVSSSVKYPLIWLVEGWKGNKHTPGIKFDKVTFYISCNSKVEVLNEERVGNFDINFKVANDFIKQLKLVVKISEESISYEKKSNFSTSSGRQEKQSKTSDVWDTLIIQMDLIANTNCLKKLCSL